MRRAVHGCGARAAQPPCVDVMRTISDPATANSLTWMRTDCVTVSVCSWTERAPRIATDRHNLVPKSRASVWSDVAWVRTSIGKNPSLLHLKWATLPLLTASSEKVFPGPEHR